MPRAGSGGSRSSARRSSSHRSSGVHSPSRSSGGHRIGSGSGRHSRAGSGRSASPRPSSSGGHRIGPSFHSAPPPPPPNGGPGMPPPPFGGPGMPPPPPRRYRRRSYRRTYYGSSAGSSFGSVVAAMIVLVILLFFFSFFFPAMASGRSNGSFTPASTRNREKLDSGLPYDSNCIVDELDWFDSISGSGRQLKTFYDKTGVQPFIVLLKYHPELVTEPQMEAYAQEYYEENIDNEATFLYMYFAEEDQDNEVGYMCYVNGKQVDSVMDAEAVNILWGYLDRDWYSTMSTDELFENAFTKTAETIMTKSRTKIDVVFAAVVGIVIIAVTTVMNTRRRHERTKET
ncbi:MAG: hypothetical protein K2I96_08590 [Lachnospiraceae bacterium]|nr:hypothetical protein [Lachnospiraceae bacterium]